MEIVSTDDILYRGCVFWFLKLTSQANSQRKVLMNQSDITKTKAEEVKAPKDTKTLAS